LGGQQLDVLVFRPGPEVFLTELRNPGFLGLAVVGKVTLGIRGLLPAIPWVG